MTQQIAVVGSLNLDIAVAVDHHPRVGETVLGGDNTKTPGGKGANQAVGAARLGGEVAMIGRVGDDHEGHLLIEAVSASGVDTSHVVVTPEAPTGVAMIAIDDAGENTIVVSPGANGRMSAEDIGAAGSVVRAAAATLLQLEIPLEAVVAAAEASSGVIVLNPAPARRLPDKLLSLVDVLVPNRGELAALLGEDEPASLEAAAAMARRIEGPRSVVVTLGSEGALVAAEGEVLHEPAFEVTAVDTTAAGDAFCGALAEALVRGSSVAGATRVAAAAAALTVTTRGAQEALPSLEEVQALASTRPD